MSSAYTDDLLATVMENAPAVFGGYDTPVWRFDDGRSYARITGYSRPIMSIDHTYNGPLAVITVRARFWASHGPFAEHAWTISAESDAVAWSLLKIGRYSIREGWVNDNVKRHRYLDGSSAMVQHGGVG